MYDVVVIGGGPGGYVAAIRAAQLGGKVALVEAARLGGTCLNWGCIPTKALLRSAEVFSLAHHASEFGVEVDGVRLDYARVNARKDRIVQSLVDGLGQLMRANGVTVVNGRGRLTSPRAVQVTPGGGGEPTTVEGRAVIVATGSNPAFLLLPGLDLPGVVTSDGALLLDRVPESAVVIGGGVVGVEFASIWRAFGARVDVVELLPQLLPPADEEIGRRLGLAFRRKGIGVHTGAKLKDVVAREAEGPFGPRKAVRVETKDGLMELEADLVLVAVGRRPNVARLGLEEAGVPYDRKGVGVDDRMETPVDGVYAVGDVTGGTMLAHAAFHQGLVAAENAMGHPSAWGDRVVPACVFAIPEVAWVGLSEAEARAQGIEVEVGKFPFAALGKAQIAGETDGLVKIVAEAAGEPGAGAVLGVHILGPAATELVQEGVLAVQQRVRARDLAATIHPHPTLVEAVGEAAHVLLGAPVHTAPRRR